MGTDDQNVIEVVTKTRLGPNDIVVIRILDAVDFSARLVDRTVTEARAVIHAKLPGWDGLILVLPETLDLYSIGDAEAEKLYAALARRLGKRG